MSQTRFPVLVACATVALTLGAAAEAAAQAPSFYARPSPVSPIEGFFSMLFGGLQPRAPRYEPMPEALPAPGESYSRAVAIGYCVRTCDGRYFPMQGRPTDAGDPDGLAQCNAFCPAARMEVYTSSDLARGIEAAISRDGAPYSQMPNAYVYRQKLVDGCTCTGDRKIGGLARIDLTRDPTLKRGDVVMTKDGSRVFAGGSAGDKVASKGSGRSGGGSASARPPYRPSDFVLPSRFPELPRDMRARIDELALAAR